MQKLLYVGIGGFIGSCFRYLIAIASPGLFGNRLPFGTLIVNVAGGFLIGLIMAIGFERGALSQDLKLFLTTGLMGGFTTFSTFSFETVALLQQGQIALGSVNVALNLLLSLGGVVAGKSVAALF